MSLLRDMKLTFRDRIFLSRDESVDLTGVLSCHATLFECLRHNKGRSIKQDCSRYIMKNINSMNTYVLLNVEHKNDVTVIVRLLNRAATHWRVAL